MTDEAISTLDGLLYSDDIVLIAPLNWGLGHASRSVPVIRHALKRCKDVIIASDGDALLFLQHTFPNCKCVSLPPLHISYPFEEIALNIVWHTPALIRHSLRDQFALQRMVKEYRVTKIISDNRPGCFVSGIPSFYITHQVVLLHRLPWISTLGTWLHRQVIRRFDGCLIPDFFSEDKALAPALSHGKTPVSTWFIGPLSHLEPEVKEIKWQAVILLSGPEPQRSRLEAVLSRVMRRVTADQILVIRGSSQPRAAWPETCSVIDMATGNQVSSALSATRLLICRPGYSTVMDILPFDFSVLFIPTPGQTEQEYLAKHLEKGQRMFTCPQNQINNIEKTIKSLI